MSRLRHALASAAATVALLASAPALAHDGPSTLDVMVCHIGVCNDIGFLGTTIETAPIFAPNSGDLVASAGVVGIWDYDEVTHEILWTIETFPGTLYVGQVDTATGCIEGFVNDLGTYVFLGTFYSEECL